MAHLVQIAELGASLKRSQDMSKEVLSARQATKEAVEEMAEQNAKLIRAYMEKKKQVKEVGSPRRCWGNPFALLSG